MNMYKHFIRPVIYLALCAGLIFILFIAIRFAGGASVSGLSPDSAAEVRQTSAAIE